jgi:hypothetical protein
MGVRKGDQTLKARLEGAIERRRPEIWKILDGYGIPRLEPGAPAARERVTDPGVAHKHRQPDD